MSKADNGVATFDVVVEEVERFAGVMSFEPERYFAEVYRKWVFIDPVDADTK